MSALFGGLRGRHSLRSATFLEGHMKRHGADLQELTSRAREQSYVHTGACMERRVFSRAWGQSNILCRDDMLGDILIGLDWQDRGASLQPSGWNMAGEETSQATRWSLAVGGMSSIAGWNLAIGTTSLGSTWGVPGKATLLASDWSLAGRKVPLAKLTGWAIFSAELAGRDTVG